MKLRTPENAARICELIAEGYTLRQVAREIGIRSSGAIVDWSREDEGFGEQYARAMERRWERMAEEIVEISDDGTNDWMEREGHTVPDHEHIQRSKLRADTRKWILSKMLPKRYGDRVQVAGDPEAPLIPAETDTSRVALAILSIISTGKSEEKPE